MVFLIRGVNLMAGHAVPTFFLPVDMDVMQVSGAITEAGLHIVRIGHHPGIVAIETELEIFKPELAVKLSGHIVPQQFTVV